MMETQREYYEKIFSRSRVGMLTKENIPKFSSHSKMQQFIDDNFVSSSITILSLLESIYLLNIRLTL